MLKRPNKYRNWIYEQIVLPETFPILINDVYSNVISSTNEKMDVITDSKNIKPFLHAHNCMELGYCKANSGIFIVNDKMLPYKEGDVSIFPKNTFHILHSDNRDDWIFISLNPLKLIGDEHKNNFEFIDNNYAGFRHIYSNKDYPAICNTIKSINSELTHKNHRYKKLTRLLVHELLILVERLTEPGKDSTLVDNNLFKLGSAIDFIAQNYSSRLSITDLSNACNLSETHFRRLFKLHFSMSPHEYISKYRISMAKLLILNSNSSILSISLDVGFSSISSFNIQFKKSTGKTPREWRITNSKILSL